MKSLNIFYRDGSTEHFKCKDESRAAAICAKRNVKYAEYGGRVIAGKKPVKPKQPHQMSLEELERHIQRLG